jgi:hypothetical protein
VTVTQLRYLPALPFVGPYRDPLPTWAATAPWRRAGAGVAVGWRGQLGGVLVTTEAEYETALNADRARAAVYFIPVGWVPTPTGKETPHD